MQAVCIRSSVVGLLLFSLFVALTARVVNLQLGDHTRLRQSYQRKVVFQTQLQGTRGRVLDRNGRVLALDEVRKNIAVDPKFIKDHNNPKRVQAALTQFLNVEPALIGTRLADTGRRFAYLEKYVEDHRASELNAYLSENEISKGVVFEKIKTRTYPHDNLLSHVIGFQNREGVGAAGIELEMNRFLKGKEGLRVGEKDGRRHEMVDRRKIQIDPDAGADVKLTVDQYLQYGVEEALEKAMSLYNADGAWAVVMDSRTGAILALASKPDYNLNEFYKADQELLRNQALGATYEPGSIIKPLVFAAAMNEGLVIPDEMIDCEWGTWYYNRRPIRDYHAYDELSAADVLKKSSNIGTAKIGLRMNEKLFYDYLVKFGFGRKTGIELPGEETGISRSPRNWDSLTQSRISFGHAITVTALQMASAINVIANDGYLLQPYIVSEVRDHSGDLLYQRKPDPRGERVLRPEVAQKMRGLMARITEQGGTGRRARFGEYSVAGKTGTAEKILPGGGYSKDQNIASFAGFFPAENPVLTIVVSVDEPKGEKRTGGSVAAPVFADIASYAAGYLAIPEEGF
ncbi:penicillin-binding protein 2 [Kiritimatiellaeota bacterium B1221]|nr:penicillin-binding protein 2 [Kiritimatiellaeota bacterium B1221]